MMEAIEITGFEKTYREGFWRNKVKTGLKSLSLTVHEGEIFGCLGPNGAGKTTTLKLLLGLMPPTAGTARILGRDYRDPLVKAQIGFLPEQPYFYDHLSAPELLQYYAQLSGVPGSLQRTRVAEVLRRVGLEDSGKTQLRKFSKGMLQRVGIAQAIIHDPKLLFLDEPMSGLDPVGRREVRDLIQELRDSGKTVFFSTHILSDAESLCDRVAVLSKGELRGIGVVADLTRSAKPEVEVIWEGAAALEPMRKLSSSCRESGGTFRSIVDEAKLADAMDLLRDSKARLISVNPVRGTVEDFFAESIASDERSQG